MLGAWAVYKLSETSRPGTWIAIAGVAAPVIFVSDLANGEPLRRWGFTPLLRGVQLGVAAYATQHSYLVVDGLVLGALANVDALALGAYTKDWAFAYGL